MRALTHPDRRRCVLSLLYELRREYVGARVLVRSDSYQNMTRSLSDRTLDCALVLDRELELRADLEQQTYGHEEMVLVFRSANRHHDGDHADVIANCGLILMDKEPQGLYHIIRILNDLHLEPQIRFCESLTDMTMTVETGESAAILPESVVAKLDNPSLQVLRLPSEYAKLHWMRLWQKGQINPLLEALRSRLAQAL